VAVKNSGALALVLLPALQLTTGFTARSAEIHASSIPCARAASAIDRAETIAVDGKARTYILHVPAHERDRRLPIIFAFHGRGETPELLAAYSGLSRSSDIVVFPRGLPGRGGKLSWSGTPAGSPSADDIGFVLATLARVERSACVDSERVYATGKSDGGGLAAQLACEAADRFAAVASVAGAYYPIEGGCRPSRPIAILEIHGDADHVVPYRGSERRDLPDVAQWLADWAARDGCASQAAPRPIAPNVSFASWNGCAQRTSVEGYVVSGGGHTWPGALERSGPGATTRAIRATAIIEQFFSRFRRRGA
jgi:polyhydroxybutyrate depolymerase